MSWWQCLTFCMLKRLWILTIIRCYTTQNIVLVHALYFIYVLLIQFSQVNLFYHIAIFKKKTLRFVPSFATYKLIRAPLSGRHKIINMHACPPVRPSVLSSVCPPDITCLEQYFLSMHFPYIHRISNSLKLEGHFWWL